MNNDTPKKIQEIKLNAERSAEHLRFILAAVVSWAEQKKLDKRYKSEFRKLPQTLKEKIEEDEELLDGIYVQALASHIFSSNIDDSFVRFFKKLLREDWWNLNYRPEGTDPKELIAAVERVTEYTWFMTVMEVDSVVEADLLYVRDLDDDVVSLLYSPSIYNMYMREMDREEYSTIYFGGLFLNNEHCLLAVEPSYSFVSYRESDFSFFAEKLDPDWYGKYGMSSVFTLHPVTFAGLLFFGNTSLDEFMLNTDDSPLCLHQIRGEFGRDLTPEGLSSRVFSPFSMEEKDNYFEISVNEGSIFTTPFIYGDWKEKKVWLRAFTDNALELGKSSFSEVFTFPETADVEASVSMWIAIFKLLKDKNPPDRIERLFHPEPLSEELANKGVEDLGGDEKEEEEEIEEKEEKVLPGPGASETVSDFFGLHPDLMYRILRNPGVEKVKDLLRLDEDAFERTKGDSSFIAPIYMGLIKIIEVLSEEEGGSVKLTQKTENLPQRILKKILVYTPRSERSVEFIHYARRAGELMGLLARTSGRLSLTTEGLGYSSLHKRNDKTPKTYGLFDEPIPLYKELYEKLFFCLLDDFNWAYDSEGDELPLLQSSAVFLLFLLRKLSKPIDISYLINMEDKQDKLAREILKSAEEDRTVTAVSITEMTEAYYRAFPVIKREIHLPPSEKSFEEDSNIMPFAPSNSSEVDRGETEEAEIIEELSFYIDDRFFGFFCFQLGFAVPSPLDEDYWIPTPFFEEFIRWSSKYYKY